MNDTTTLYRLFDKDDALLYVGIARTWQSRMLQHAADKDWWHDVARIDVIAHPTRDAALEAERLTIMTEGPRHNIMHNGTGSRHRRQPPEAEIGYQPSLGMPLRRGQCVALGLRTGECPVGLVESADEEWVSITHFNWMIELFVGKTLAFRIADVERVLWADWRSGMSMHGHNDVVFEMDPLAEFQTKWKTKMPTEPVS